MATVGAGPPAGFIPAFQIKNSLPYTLVVGDGGAWQSKALKPPEWWINRSRPNKRVCSWVVVVHEGFDGRWQQLHRRIHDLDEVASWPLPLPYGRQLEIDCYGQKGLTGTFNFTYRPGPTPSLQELTCSGCETPVNCGSTIPTLTNAGWTSGMGNTLSVETAGYSFWTLDFGTEKERWRVDAPTNAIVQTTQKDPTTNNCGSRAYPASIPTLGTWAAGVGSAKSGCWQIDIKTDGKYDGKRGACITFYLAQRENGNMAPGAANYGDGAGSGGNYTMEIDIMETGWKQGGPQWNFPKPKVAGNSWTSMAGTDSVQGGNWTDVGGVLTSFCTFGAYIDDSSPANCWIYGYKPDGTQWYCTAPVPNNKDAVTLDLVPYIGVWTSNSGPPDYICNYPTTFDTYYRNFVYKPTSGFPSGTNPKKNPELFGAPLVK